MHVAGLGSPTVFGIDSSLYATHGIVNFRLRGQIYRRGKLVFQVESLVGHVDKGFVFLDGKSRRTTKLVESKWRH